MNKSPTGKSSEPKLCVWWSEGGFKLSHRLQVIRWSKPPRQELNYKNIYTKPTSVQPWKSCESLTKTNHINPDCLHPYSPPPSSEWFDPGALQQVTLCWLRPLLKRQEEVSVDVLPVSCEVSWNTKYSELRKEVHLSGPHRHKDSQCILYWVKCVCGCNIIFSPQN